MTGKCRSTVEPGGCTARDSIRIGHACLHATDVYGHITLATAVPPPGEGRAPAAGTNLAPPGDRQAPAVDEGPYAPLGEGWASAAGDNHVPSENRQAPAVDEGPFLSRIQGSSDDPDGG